MNISIQTCHAESLTAEIGFLSEFRLRYFRDFPYLYAGIELEEQAYLAEYIADSTARLLLARDGLLDEFK